MADMNGLGICKRHNRPFEVYCEDHKVFACSTCVIVNHKACSEVEDVESVSELCTCLDDLKLGLQNSEQAIYKSLGNIEEAQTCLTNDAHDVEENLSNLRTKLIDTFDKFAEKIMVEANSYRDLKDAALAKQKIECENELASIQSSLTHINEIAAQGTQAQHAITAHTTADEIKNKMGNAESLSTQLNTINISMNFDELFDTINREVALALNPRKFERKYSVPRKWKLNPVASTDLKRTGDDVKEPYYVGLDFLPDGRLIAVDRKNRRCLIYDEHLTVLSVYNVAISPIGVAAVSEENFVIFGYNIYYFLHVSAFNTITYTGSCEDKNHDYDSIRMENNTPVPFSVLKGEYTDLAFPHKTLQLLNYFCMHINKRGGEKKRVALCREEDTFEIYYGTSLEKVLLVQDELIKKPNGLALGPNEHVFVGSRSTLISSLVEISDTGHVISSTDVGMCAPYIVHFVFQRTRRDWQSQIVQPLDSVS